MIMLLVAAPRTAQAGSFTVTTTADALDANPGDGVCDDGDGNCTLRAAIMESNMNGDPVNIVNVPAGHYLLTIPNDGSESFYTPNDTMGDLDINKSIQIYGAGAGSTIIDGNGTSKVLSFNPTWPAISGFDATIADLTLTGGKSQGDDIMGGAMDWASDSGYTLTIDRCIIQNSVVSGNGMGGGLMLYGGAVNIDHTRIAGNTSDYQGGGIYVGNSTALTVTDSVISGNTGEQGGGIWADSGDVTIANSTIVSNIASHDGGGLNITMGATLQIWNATIAKNSASGQGGGILVSAGSSASAANITVVENTAASTGGLAGGPMTVNNSIVTNNTGGNGTVSGTANKVGAAVTGLGPLTTIKGWQRVYPLLPGSSAIEAGDNASAEGSTDQRGAERILDSADVDTTATVDVGAFEASPDMEKIPDKTISGGMTSPVTFRTGSGTFSAVASSNNQSVVPDSGLEITGIESSRTLNITPAGSGTATITVTLSDSGYSVSDSFVVTVGSADLTITKTHDGNFLQGGSGTYTLTVGNAGDSASSGMVTVTEQPPTGMTVTGMSGTGWTCTGATCTRSDSLAKSASFPAIKVSVDVASNAAPSLTNRATVSGGGETNTTNDEAPDVTTILQNTVTTASALSAQYGDAVKLKATVTTGIAGNVQFSLPGAGTIATAPVDTATGLATSAPVTMSYDAKDYSLTATFVPGDGAHYASSQDTKTLTVTRAPLTVTVANKTKTYGDANPPLTATYSGFVLGQGTSVLDGSLSTTATQSSSVGSYPITASGLTAANYTITFTDGTLTVTPAALSVTVQNKTRTYGAANPPLTAAYSGLVLGQDETVLGGTLTTTATIHSDVGDYPITAIGLTSANYTITYTDGTLTVVPAALTVRADDKAKTYGDDNPALTESYSGFVLGQDKAVLGGTLTLTTTAEASSAAGNYDIVPTGLTATNYAVTFANGTLTVTPAPLTVTADDKSKVYGGANPPLTATFSGFVLGQDEGVLGGTLALTTAAGASSNAGTYAIVPAGLTATNYTVTFVNGTLTVTPAPLTVTADDKSKVYGNANPTFTATYSGFVLGQDAGVLGGALSTPATQGSDVGDYPITASGLTSANYTITYTDGTLTVTPAPLTITVVDKTKTYGDANPLLTATYSGFVLGQSESVLGGSLSTTATQSSDVGDYPITASGLTAANYKITYTDGTLTVAPAPLTVTVQNQSKTYGGANPTLTATYSGFVLGQDESVLGGMLTTTATDSSDVGGYPITASDLTADNYSITFTDGTLTVLPALLTVRADDKAKTYGDDNPAFTESYSGFVLGQDKGALGGTLTLTTAAGASSAAGPYAIVPAGLTSTNYTISFANGTLTVNKALLTVTAGDQSKVYGSANPTFTATYSGFVLGQNESVLGGTLTLTTAATVASDVGEYAIVPAGRTSANYEINNVAGRLTVTPAALTVTADDHARTYGSNDTAFTATYSGFVLGQGPAVLGGALSFTTPATTGSDVGEYTLTPAGVTSGNYAITFVDGKLSITPAALTVRADDKSKPYGSDNPIFTASYSGFVLGQDEAVLGGTLSFGTLADASSILGTYAIVPAGLSSTNYAISFVGGKLTVTPAPLTVTADDKSKVYGSANPTFTATYSGFVLGQNKAVLGGTLTLTTAADASSAAGPYAIVPAGLTSPNYTISFANGTLTVDKAVLTVTAGDQSKVYGSANPTFTATYSGFVLGQDESVLGGTLTLTTTATVASDVGDYAIVPAGRTSANYEINDVPGKLTVTPAALTVTANDHARTYGSDDSKFTATYSGFVLGQDPAVLGGELHIATSAKTDSGVGDYALTPAGVTSANYAITFVDGKLSITPAALTVRADDKDRTYGHDNPTFTASYSGFVSGQDESVLGGTLSFGTTADTNSTVGTYAIVPAGLSSTNYAISFVGGTLTVSPAPLTVTADDQSKVYGSANPTFTATYSGFVLGQDKAALGGTLTLTTTADASSAVGTYGIVPAGLSSANYAISFANGKLTVTPAALTVTADDQSKIYGSANPTFTATYSGWVLGQGPSVLGGALSFGTMVDANSDVGTYAIVPAGLSSTNYAISFVGGKLAVSPAPLTVTADDKAKTYGDANPTFTASYSGFVLGQDESVLGGTLSVDTMADAGSNVGTYAIVPAGLSSTNYAITFVGGKLSVSPTPLTVTADDQSKVYGSANPTFTATYSGFVLGQDESVLGGTVTLTTTADASSAVGTYAIVPAGLTATNYTISFVDGTLTVTKAVLTIKADDKTKTYGGANPVLTATYSGFAPGDDERVLSGTLALTTTATDSSGAGAYPITVSGLTAADYDMTFVDGTLTVTKAPLTITVAGGTMVYGGTPPGHSVSYNGFLLGQNESVLDGTLVIGGGADSGSASGTYTLVASGLSSPNYDITYRNGTVRVTPRGLSITALDATRPYGQANPAFTGNVSGLLGSDGITVSYETTATATSPAGRYPITARIADPSGRLSNYDVHTTGGTLTITEVQATVTVNSASRHYGAANPDFTATVTGLPPGMTLNLAFSTDAGAGSPVGTYPIRAALQTTVPGVQASIIDGTLTVTPASLTVTPRSITRNFGASSPELSGTVTGLQNGDPITATYSTSATLTSLPGAYPITAALSDPAGKLGNYQVSIRDATLTIRGCEAFDLTKDPTGQAQAYLHCTVSDEAKGDILQDVAPVQPANASLSEATTVQVQEAIAKARAETGTAPRVILTPDPASTAQGAVIDHAAMSQLAQAGGEVSLSTGFGTLLMPAPVLQNMAGGSDSGTLVILFEEVKDVNVQQSGAPQANQLKPASPVVEITVATRHPNGSVERHEQFGTNLTLTLPIADPNADSELAGLYRFTLDADGKITGIEYVGGELGAGGRSISVPRNHLSSYGVLVYDHDFADVPADHWAYRAIKVMTARHVVNGISDTLFDPSQAVTRAEFAAMAARAFGVEIPTEPRLLFPDVPKDKWYAATMSAMVEAGLFTPEAGEVLRPEVPITRQEMAVVIARVITARYPQAKLSTPDTDQLLAAFQDQSQLDAANRDAIARLVAAGLLKGRATDTLAPNGTTTRAEAVTLIKRLFDWGKALQQP